MCLKIIYLTHMYKEDLALNNLKGLIFNKKPTNQATTSTCIVAIKIQNILLDPLYNTISNSLMVHNMWVRTLQQTS